MSNKSKTLEYVLNESGPKAYPPEALDIVTAKAWEKVRASHSSSLVIYVHGRAAGGLGWDREPDESFKNPPIVPELETKHSATVVMIHWPHKAFLIAFPLEAAEAAAPLLAASAPALVAARPQDLAHVPVVIVTHSMGGIAMEVAVNKNGAAPFDGVATVVVSASAGALSKSATWLGKLPQGRAYVARNANDKALGLISGSGPFLGLGTTGDLATAGCAPTAFYLDVTPLKVNHRYFVIGEESGNQQLARLRDRFYDPLYRGTTPNLADFEQVTPGQPIFRLKGTA